MLNAIVVDGSWGTWSEFQPCNKSCGYGYRHRYRKCNSPAPVANGKDCFGPAIDVDGGCNPQVCSGISLSAANSTRFFMLETSI